MKKLIFYFIVPAVPLILADFLVCTIVSFQKLYQISLACRRTKNSALRFFTSGTQSVNGRKSDSIVEM
jgi:hypothetical protein